MKQEDSSNQHPSLGEGLGGLDLLDHWTVIVRAVLTAEGDILETNSPILKDETMSKEQRVALYCQNVAEEILRAIYAERA